MYDSHIVRGVHFQTPLVGDLSMQRIALGILGIMGALLMLILLVVGVVSARDSVAEEDLQRQVSPRVLWGPGMTTITLTQAARPEAVCPTERRAAHVVLLVDKSGSMVNANGFEQAVAASEQFVNVIDRSATEVAIVFFDSRPQLVQPLTSDAQELTQSLRAVEPDGSTAIGAALEMAGNVLLEAGATTEAAAIAILLSDGDAGDEVETVQAASQLRDADVRLITVALGVSDDTFLRSIASTPADFYRAPSPNELAAIYTGIAQGINEARAFDVIIEESVNPRLTPVKSSLRPGGQIDGNHIRWELATLSNNESTFAYEARVDRIGYHAVNEDATRMSFTDCVVGAVAATLVAGPAVLVLPSPGVLIPVALLPLLALGAIFWSRRSSYDRRRPQSGPAASPPALPPTDPNPAWIKQLDDRKILQSGADAQAGNLTPTVIMGLGPVGRAVLNEIAQNLRARYGGRLPEEVRLLQIDVHPRKSRTTPPTKPRYLTPDQWVLLQPDLSEINSEMQLDPDRWPHLNWYDPIATSGRMMARMGVFYDLKNGADESVLWNSLSHAANRLDKPRLRLVGSTFDDVGSALLVDVARLMQIISDSDKDVELWLSGPVGVDWGGQVNDPDRPTRRSDQAARTLATLRELERFQRNARIPFHYVGSGSSQSQLRSETNSAVVQTLYLFEPETPGMTVDDHLGVIADCLLATIHQPVQQTISQHLSLNQQTAGRFVNESGIGTVCSIGSHTVRTPLGLLEEALGWRLLYELLFERHIGIWPVRTLQPDGSYKSVEAIQVVDDDGEARRSAAEKLVGQFRSKLGSTEFLHTVAREASLLLNGERDPSPIKHRVGGLLQAQLWLESVRAMVRREGDRQVAEKISALLQEVAQWQTFLNEVAPQVDERRKQAQEVLRTLLDQKSRRWALNEALEWPVYQDRMRPRPEDITTLQRAAERFGWYVVYHEGSASWQLQLLAPPGDFVWHDEVFPPAFALPRDPKLAEQLYDLVSPLVRNRAQAEFALDEAAKLEPQRWLDRAAPRLEHNSFAAADQMNGEIREKVLLVAPSSYRATQLKQRLEKTQHMPDVVHCETEDYTSVALLRLRNRVPLSTYRGYDVDSWAQNFVEPRLYIWRGEQLASHTERDDGRLDTQFIGWMEQDNELLSLLSWAYLFGLLEHDSHSSEWWLPGLGQWKAESFGDAIEGLFSVDSHRQPKPLQSPNQHIRARARAELQEAIEQRRSEIERNPGSGIRSYRQQIRDELVKPLRENPDRRIQSLALYLQWLVDEL